MRLGPNRTKGPATRESNVATLVVTARTVFLVQLDEVKMSIPAPCLIDRIPIGDSSQKGPRMFGERVEGQSVQDHGDELHVRMSACWMPGWPAKRSYICTDTNAC